MGDFRPTISVDAITRSRNNNYTGNSVNSLNRPNPHRFLNFLNSPRYLSDNRRIFRLPMDVYGGPPSGYKEGR